MTDQIRHYSQSFCSEEPLGVVVGKEGVRIMRKMEVGKKIGGGEERQAPKVILHFKRSVYLSILCNFPHFRKSALPPRAPTPHLLFRLMQ